MTDFGSGIHLDEQLDFAVGSTGDLKSESGVNELEKDLAYNMILNLQEFLGRPPSETLEAEVLNKAKLVAEADTRVDKILPEGSNVTFTDGREEIELVLSIQADGTEQQLVFNI